MVTYTGLGVRVRIGAACLPEDCLHKIFEIVVGVGIVEALGEAEDENAWVRSLHLDLRVVAVQRVQRQENVAHGGFRIAAGAATVVRCLGIVAFEQMVSDNRVDLDPAEEAALRLENTP